MAKEEAEIKELSKKLAQNPDSMVFVQLADAYRRAGELEKSIEVCQQGLERHPTYATARSILGRNYLDLEKLDEAEAEFRQIEVADPENIMAHRMLGQIYLQKGQYADAIARQQRVLALDPDDGTAQELLQQALQAAKQAEQSPTAAAAPAAAAPAPAPAPAAPAPKANDAQSGTLKVAEIYIKKGALDEAAEVLQEILAADPDHAVAKQRLQEVNERRGVKSESAKAAEEAERKKAEDEAKAKAAAEEAERKKAEEEAARKKAEEEAAKKKAEDEAKAKAAEEAAKKKAEEEAKAKAAAEEAERKKAEEEAAKKKAEEEAKAKAAEEAERKKAEEEAAKKKAEEEAKAKAAAEAAKKKAEEEAKAKAEEEAERKQAEEAARKAEEEAKERKAAKLSSEDILSVMAGGSDDLIEDEPASAKASAGQGSKGGDKAPAASGSSGASAEIQKIIDDFVKAQSIEACLLMDNKGELLDSRHAGQASSLGQTASTIFNNTEKAAGRMHFGGLKQIMIVGEDGRQILFVALKAGVLVALTGKQTNLGLLRVAVNDLVKRA
jgi:predicted regulator of Ras-like GTPase activity (Roadblock/LC7/MglB family)